MGVVISGYFSSIGIHGSIASKISKKQKMHANKIMQKLEIQNLKNISFGKMSSGQQRRCLLARSLVHNPKTLILDEPTSGLDISGSFAYLNTLRNLIRNSHNIILVTHQLNEIPPEINRVILIKDGKIYCDGPKEEILTEENLTDVFETEVSISKINNYYIACPKHLT